MSGPSIDGKGEFSQLHPAPKLGQEPELQHVPMAAHAGPEATDMDANGAGSSETRRGLASELQHAIQS